jgi:hypothetical protein
MTQAGDRYWRDVAQGRLWVERCCSMPRPARRVCDGPMPGGRFWGLSGASALHTDMIHVWMPLRRLTDAGCRVWWRRFTVDGSIAWTELSSPDDPALLASWQTARETTWWDCMGIPHPGHHIEVYVIGHRGGLALPRRTPCMTS